MKLIQHATIIAAGLAIIANLMWAQIVVIFAGAMR